MTRNATVIASLASCALALGCSSHGSHHESASPGSTSSGSEAHRVLTEAQTVDVLTTIDHAEIDLARMVDARQTSASAHSMAQMMITQHTQAQAQIDDWARGASVTPAPNEVSQTLVHDVAGVRERLQAADDAGVGRAYLESQVRMHHDALALIDERMMPGVQDPSFRALLTQIRATVAAHMAHAQQLIDDAI
jgi:putative membrane protein